MRLSAIVGFRDCVLQAINDAEGILQDLGQIDPGRVVIAGMEPRCERMTQAVSGKHRPGSRLFLREE